MAYRFYAKERAYNEDLYNIKISAQQGQKLANKLTRHFKFRKITVYSNARTRGHAYWRDIDIPKITSVALVIHECAHIYNGEKHGAMKHVKKLHTTIKRFSNYFRKYLKPQFSELELPKPKPKPTLEEKYLAGLQRSKKSISRLETKIKTLKTRLNTAKKKRTKFQRRLRQIRSAPNN